jgi:hypothetical protein
MADRSGKGVQMRREEALAKKCEKDPTDWHGIIK